MSLTSSKVTLPLAELSVDGMNAPLHSFDTAEDFAPNPGAGASRYQATIREGCHLDALLVNEGSDTLIVTFHGALDRGVFQIPRFERIKSTREFGQSMLFLADPGLWADRELQLSWFAGWEGQDVAPTLATWSLAAARAVGASRLLFTGSSGGGFAALQVSALIPGSVCLPFNPQTSIHGYLASGTSYAAQRKFIDVFYPRLAPAGGVVAMDLSDDWAAQFGPQLSALLTYSVPRENFVLYADNVHDFHHEQHLAPLTQAMRTGHNDERFRVHTYEGQPGHRPPTPDEFRAGMAEALQWCRELSPIL